MKAWSPLEALEATLGVAVATGRTYCPEEILARAPVRSTEAPRSLSELSTAASTAVVYENILRRQAEAETQPQGEPGSLGPRPESFEILGTIGEGGMGIVFRARQGSLGREVAVKQIRERNAAAEHYFMSEAQITARLEHANIVPVHLLGRADDGAPLLVMKLVKGTSWSALIEGPEAEKVTLKDHLQILFGVCNAMAFAHRQGFLHRDLKPENVMVGEFGQVFVMDWGVAVGLDRAACQESAILHVADVRSPAGTPGFMAPELASGEGEKQSERTDVYLLGACLHAVLTRSSPHKGPSVREVLERAIESRPFTYDESVPRELAAVVNQAMAREPEDRFPSVEAFRAALEAFQEHGIAHGMIIEGRAGTERARARVKAFAEASSEAREEIGRGIDQSATEARFAFEHALGVWAGADEAREGLRALNRLLLDHALESEDLALATRLLEGLDDVEARGKVEALRARLEARAKELLALRDNARRLDWSAIAPALGSVFILAGVLGGLGAVASWEALQHASTGSVLVLGTIWCSLALVSGAYALLKLRGSGARDNLLSPRVFGTWAAVVIGCLINGVSAQVRHIPPFQDAHESTAMVGIGFAAMAFQTRLWLLIPAFAYFVVAVLMGIWPEYSLGLFGLLWLTTMCGVGIAFRLGATLGEVKKEGG
ncbi:MAG: serine/threonine-protein kinase [Minicystis sp.]